MVRYASILYLCYDFLWLSMIIQDKLIVINELYCTSDLLLSVDLKWFNSIVSEKWYLSLFFCLWGKLKYHITEYLNRFDILEVLIVDVSKDTNTVSVYFSLYYLKTCFIDCLSLFQYSNKESNIWAYEILRNRIKYFFFIIWYHLSINWNLIW